MKLFLISETGRHNPSVSKTAIIKRVFVTDGLTMPLTGKAIVTYKTIRKELNMRNINDVTYQLQCFCKFYCMLTSRKFFLSSLI